MKKFIKVLGVYSRKILRRMPLTREALITVVAGPMRGCRLSVALGDVYRCGQYEPETVAEAQQRIGKQDIVYDIGANAGYLTMVFAKCCQWVYAFEPLEMNIKRWKQHISVNHIKNAELHPFAICDSDRVLVFSRGHSAFSNRYERHAYSSDGLRVAGRSIDSLVASDTARPPNVLKIDVEGAEFDVLQGAKETLVSMQPLIFLATHDCHNPGVQAACVELLESLGYECRKTSEKKVIAGLCDYICIPKT